jgi:hypothetical protein
LECGLEADAEVVGPTVSARARSADAVALGGVEVEVGLARRVTRTGSREGGRRGRRRASPRGCRLRAFVRSRFARMQQEPQDEPGARRSELVDALPPLAALSDEPSLFQHLEMLRDRVLLACLRDGGGYRGGSVCNYAHAKIRSSLAAAARACVEESFIISALAGHPWGFTLVGRAGGSLAVASRRSRTASATADLRPDGHDRGRRCGTCGDERQKKERRGGPHPGAACRSRRAGMSPSGSLSLQRNSSTTLSG